MSDTSVDRSPVAPVADRPARRRITARGVAAGALVLLIAAVCARLGVWQLDRLEERRARNTQVAQALALPALPLNDENAAAIARDPAAYVYRRVHVEAAFTPAADVLLRGRSHLGQPGVHLLSQLEIDDAVVLVNRGWLPAADGVSADPREFATTGRQAFDALVQLYPDAVGDGGPTPVTFDGFPVLTLRRLDTEALQAASGGRLLPFYIQQLPAAGADELPAALDVPSLDEGPHLGYALQWFGLSAVFVCGFVAVLARSGRRERG